MILRICARAPREEDESRNSPPDLPAPLEIAPRRDRRAGPGFSLTISYCLYKLLFINAGLNLDAAFSALADPTRRAILARLAEGEATVMELAEPFDMTQPAISQHLKVLEGAGLVITRIEGTRRPRRLSKVGLEAMNRWLAMLRKALEKNYRRLDEVLDAMEEQKPKRGEKQ